MQALQPRMSPGEGAECMRHTGLGVGGPALAPMPIVLERHDTTRVCGYRVVEGMITQGGGSYGARAMSSVGAEEGVAHAEV